MANVLQLSPSPPAKFNDLLDGVTIFTLEAEDQAQAFFDFLQASRIKINLFVVIPHKASEIFNLVDDLIDSVTLVAPGFVQFDQVADELGRLAQQICY